MKTQFALSLFKLSRFLSFIFFVILCPWSLKNLIAQDLVIKKIKFDSSIEFSLDSNRNEIVCILVDPEFTDEFRNQNNEFIQHLKSLDWSGFIDSSYIIRLFLVEPKKDQPGMCPIPTLRHGNQELPPANRLTDGYIVLLDTRNIDKSDGGFERYLSSNRLTSSHFTFYSNEYGTIPTKKIRDMKTFFRIIQSKSKSITTSNIPIENRMSKSNTALLTEPNSDGFFLRTNYIIPPSSLILKSQNDEYKYENSVVNGFNILYGFQFSDNSPIIFDLGFSYLQSSSNLKVSQSIVDSVGRFKDVDGDSYTSVAYYTSGSEKISLTAIDFSPSISYNIGSQSFQKGKWNLSAGLGLAFSLFTRRQYEQSLDTFALGTYYPQYLTSDTIFNGLGGTYQIKESYNSSALTSMKAFNASLSVPLRFSYFVTDGFGVNLGYSLNIGLLNLANPGRTYEPGKVSYNSILSFSDKIRVNSHIVSLGFIFKI